MLFLQSHVKRIVKVPKLYFWKRLRAFDKIQTLLPRTIKEVKIPDNFSNSIVSDLLKDLMLFLRGPTCLLYTSDAADE